MKVGICGYGWVGKAMHSIFPNAVVYDKYLHIVKGTTKKHLGTQKAINTCDVVFIGVPTPNNPDGSLDCSIVEEVISWCEAPLIVIRSTVQPGFCNDMMVKYKKQIVMQPEYLGETVAHPLLNEGERPFIIIGGAPKPRRKLIELYQTVYNANIRIRQVSALEAEVIKLSENRAIAFKVAQCQELYDACEASEVDYYTVRDAVYGDDPRFNLWWTFVYPDQRGFNSSKCLIKDVPAWCAWAESLGYNPKISRAIVNRSNEYAENQID